MKNNYIFLLFAFFFVQFSFGQDSYELNSEPELLKTWSSFTKAIKDSDKTLLQDLCMDSVKFSMQMGDLKLLATSGGELPLNNSSEVIIDFDNYFYLGFDEFYTYEMPQLFDKNVMSRLDDETKMRLIKTNEPDADYKFIITVTDPDEGLQGNEMVLRFKKTGSQYQFSGIDTIQ